MNQTHQTRMRRPKGFTLVELLVVIAIIAVLAALIFPAAKTVKEKAARNRVKAELRLIETAITSYQGKFGHYPPDNSSNPANANELHAFNQLYFELSGTKEYVEAGTKYFQTLDGSAKIPQASVATVFGAQVTGFINYSHDASGDGQAAKNFLVGAKISKADYNPNPGVRLLVSPVEWPENLGNIVAQPRLNPVRYKSSNPTHNPKSYDLWVDVVLGGKTNRISNWNDTYEIVP